MVAPFLSQPYKGNNSKLVPKDLQKTKNPARTNSGSNQQLTVIESVCPYTYTRLKAHCVC